MQSDTSVLSSSLDGLHTTPWILFEGCMVTNGMKAPPWPGHCDVLSWFPFTSEGLISPAASRHLSVLSLLQGSPWLRSLIAQYHSPFPKVAYKPRLVSAGLSVPPLTSTRGSSSLRTSHTVSLGVSRPASQSCTMLLSPFPLHMYWSWEPSPKRAACSSLPQGLLPRNALGTGSHLGLGHMHLIFPVLLFLHT